MRRTLFLLTASLAGSLAPLVQAFAHWVTGGEEDGGNELLWLYGLVLAAIAGFVIYRKKWPGNVSPERRALKRQLSDFERALTLCMSQLQNADDYPKECGLTEKQRLDRVQSAASIREKIDEKMPL